MVSFAIQKLVSLIMSYLFSLHELQGAAKNKKKNRIPKVFFLKFFLALLKLFYFSPRVYIFFYILKLVCNSFYKVLAW